MTKYREILRLRSLEFSERNIARSAGVSRNTVKKVLARADELDLEWPLDFGMTDSALEELTFPREKSATNKRMPDFDYIRKELMRNGVNKKLLWYEYMEECRQAGEEGLQYSQFCWYIQQDEQNWEYMSGSSPLARQSSMYSVQRSFLLTQLRSSSLWM